MLLLELIVALSWIWVPVLVIILLIRGIGKKPSAPVSSSEDIERDQLWRNYVGSFMAVVKTDDEKRLLNTLIEGKTPAEFSGTTEQPQAEQTSDAWQPLGDESAPVATDAVPVMAASTYQQPVATKPVNPMDNTILLLYFGAFLLVTSVGLFVAIGGLDGIVRTIIVGITAATLYAGGMWLYQTNKKLAQAGISFVGTGMMIAPLTGVAWYTLVSDQTNGGLIWLITSLACIGLYAHAYNKIKNGFIAYLLIGSFVSSIESAVLTIDLPTYGYAWGLIAAGLLLAINSRSGNQSAEFSKSSDVSSSLLIPLSILGSIALLPQFGSTQLAVSLLLSGVYYALLAKWQTAERSQFASAAQVSLIAAAANLAYAMQESLVVAGITLSVITLLYSLAIIMTNKDTLKLYNLVPIASASNLVAVLASLGDAWALVAGLAVATLLATVVWRKLDSDETLQIAGLLLIGLPPVAGLYALDLRLGSTSQLLLCLVSALLLGALVTVCSLYQSYKSYYRTASYLYILAAVLLLIPAGVQSFAALSIVSGGIIVSFGLLRYLAKDSNWLLLSSLTAFVPLCYALLDYGVGDQRFSVAVLAALVLNISVSLITRQALGRWLVVICIVITPFAIGGGGLGINWNEAGYAGGYLLAMVSCITARAIARGKLLLSSKVPVASYYTEASQAYVAGYTLTGIISVLVSLFATQSQLITTLILGSIALLIVLINKIERKTELLALLPLIAQGMLFSAIRPDLNDPAAVGLVALVSTLAALGVYAIIELVSASNTGATAQSTRLISVITAYIGPGLVITQDAPSMLLPASLFLAGAITFVHNRAAKQSTKELSVGVCYAALHWLVLLAGYSNIHIHTHLLAVLLLGFAIWRSSLGDPKASLSYVQALFFVVTVPLALQGLNDVSGGTYGLILIAEQVCFMIAGATFGQRFLLKWGLWTSLAAILFQLRGLGWAFLSLLALIIIGVAVYRLQKHAPEDTSIKPNL